MSSSDSVSFFHICCSVLSVAAMPALLPKEGWPAMSPVTSVSRAPQKCPARPNSKRSLPPKLEWTRGRNSRTSAGAPYVRIRQAHQVSWFLNASPGNVLSSLLKRIILQMHFSAKAVLKCMFLIPNLPHGSDTYTSCETQFTFSQCSDCQRATFFLVQ